MNSWIKFADKKPEEDGQYLCLTIHIPGETGFNDYEIGILNYNSDRKLFGWYDFGCSPTFYRGTVDYWMPLPLLPWEDPNSSH